jgi:hypothetical protein
MKVRIENRSKEKRDKIYEKYNGVKPSKLLDELIIYTEEYDIRNWPEVKYPHSTLEELRVILFKWQYANCQTRFTKKWAKGINFASPGNPHLNDKEI